MPGTSRARAAVAATANREDPTKAVERANEGNSLRADVQRMQDQFAAAMPRGAEAAQLVRDALTALNMVPKLGECTRNSVLGALMTCAQLGLRPNVPALGHAWLIPFWDSRERVNKAQLIVGYQGMVELAQRSGRIQSLVARVVHERDEFYVNYGLEDALVHKPVIFGDAGDPIAYYAVAKFKDGGHAFVVLNRDQVEAFRKRSKSKDNGPWVTDYDAMAMKTTVRQLFKWMPKSTDLAIAMSADESVRVDLTPESIEQVQGDFIDVAFVEPLEPTAEQPPANVDTATGEVTGWVNDDPDPCPVCAAKNGEPHDQDVHEAAGA